MNRKATNPPDEQLPVFDPHAALVHTDGNADLLHDLAEMLLDLYPTLVSQLRAAARDHAGQELRQAAHRLEGSLSTFFAGSAISVAQNLQELGKCGNWDEVTPQLDRLDVELAKLDQCLRKMLES